ncbi:MAG: RNA pseudouridine synthase [Pedosphaera sp.]|nr:RNA pseudouridine synthase [Pedosphaera sp.]
MTPPIAPPQVIKFPARDAERFWEVPVLFEDEHLLALDKPAGLPASPERSDLKRPNILSLLHQSIASGTSWATSRKLSYLANTHRLDSETSGVLLLAKTKAALIHLCNQFGQQRNHITYTALSSGHPQAMKNTVDTGLSPNLLRPELQVVNSRQGKRAITQYEVFETFPGHCLIRVSPLTQRTHQVRAHLKHVGLSIVGDMLYGGSHLYLSSLKQGYREKASAPEQPLIRRLALHAESMRVIHPATGAEIFIESPLTKDFGVALKYLRKYSRGG